MALNKDQILAADDIELRKVNVPEWGGEVFVRTLTGQGRDRWEAGLEKSKKNGVFLDSIQLRASLLVHCLVDENGVPLFEVSDVEELSRKSSKPISRLFDIAASMAGFTKQDLEEAEKN